MRSVLIATALASVASAATVEVWYNITKVIANPDGQFPRSAIGVNGTWPPPPLNVHVGDTVIVHAHNSLDEPTALHHHGIFFNGSSYYDGAPAVTQCGIPVGQSLTYTIPVNDQWGTYWWHSHVGDQYVDGLRAPFLIHPAVEAHVYDEEYTVIVSDWYHKQHKTLMNQFLSVFNPAGAEPVPETALIYIAQNGTYLPGFNKNASIPFEAGKTYRLRFINQGAFAMFNIWLDGHQMRVIEVDGTDVEEYPIDSLSISVAQRYSVLVTAKNTTTQNFALHANFEGSMFDPSATPAGIVLNYSTTVVYAANAPMAPTDLRTEFGRTPDELFVPVIVEQQLVADRRIELGVWFDTFDNGINRAAFNNITYQMPVVPTLFSQLSMGANASDVAVYGPQTHAYVLKKGEVIDLQVINWDANAHPFHLHGHKYQIVRVAMDVASSDPLMNPPHTEGGANPMRRDTVNVPAGGAVNMRFIADNPGTWIFHCHIEWHMESGLAMVFIEAPTESQQTLKVPQIMFDQCADLGIPHTGNAVGRMSTTDLAGVKMGPYPQILGWLPKGIVALVGTILAALLGMAAVVWYAFGGQLDADEVEDEVRRGMEAKAAKGGGLKARAWTGVKGLVTKRS